MTSGVDDDAKTCVSLFSCAGMGDLGLEAAGFRTISCCELVHERAELLARNFPRARVFRGDVWELRDAIVEHARAALAGARLDAMIVSAPCQGASSNGMGRIQSQVRKGKRERDDPRNRLILPAIDVIDRLRPKVVIVENVPGMRHTCIVNEDGAHEPILSILNRRLPDYVVRSTVLNTADYGVPQTRRRLITICVDAALTPEPKVDDVFSDEPSALHPPPTHGPRAERPHATLRACIGDLPPLDARECPCDPDDAFHRVPRWSERQYFCMQHTPEGQTAMRNDACAACGAAAVDASAVACAACGALLPRPIVRRDGQWRRVRAFDTAYRRMRWDRPANALTTTSGVISSDVKGHPSQHRVLSLREIMRVAGVNAATDPPFAYEFDGASDKLVRDALGECIPPPFAHAIGAHLARLCLSPDALAERSRDPNAAQPLAAAS